MLSMVISFYKQREQRKDALRSYAEVTILAIIFVFKGFVKLKKIKKIQEKVGSGWVGQAPTRYFIFWEDFVFCVVFMFQMFQKKIWIGGWVGEVKPIRVFLGFFST